MSSFADQAVIAIENVRLFKELEARTELLSRSVGQLTALGEVGQAVSSTLDLETVLQTIVSRALQLTGLDSGSIYEYDEQAQVFRLQAAENMPEDITESIAQGAHRAKATGVARAYRALRVELTQVPDILDDELPKRSQRSAHRARVSCAPRRSAAARGPAARCAGREPQDAWRVRPGDRRSAEDVCDPIGARDPERAPLPRDRRERPAARSGEPAQIGLSRQHEPRTEHAAQCDSRFQRNDSR